MTGVEVGVVVLVVVAVVDGGAVLIGGEARVD